ncbi:hypothetical protein L596_012212 [Steinernema carpocapsae]|uniref:Beta-glucosidase n=1 Tax=Steinernema carpocapsae TaxID=34508 RepID=A0A4U5NWD0_STECR|nr:hypothetical protein L596_012212 [Steinernema carpocapsae]
MKVKAYRFSISWPRLFPNGLTEDINAEGVEYYHKLIDLLVANGIQPMVTLYHWDLPLALGDQGGWINREIVGWFGDYARFCFEEYGSKVKYWITINEAYIASLHGYCGQGEEFAPGGFKKNCEWSLYLAAHHMLLAHGRAANIYKKEFQPTQNGVIGITNLAVWYEPLTKEDEEVAKRAFEFQFGWLTHPIYGDGGDYPEVMKAKMEELKEKEGRAKSRLPQFSKQEIEELKGSADFLGINYYYGFLTSREEQKNSDLINMTTLDQWERDASMFSYYDPKWEPVGDNNSWIRNYPDGLYNTLNFVKTNYANIPVYITENGCMDTPGEDLRDVTRLRYLRNHINAVYRAISDGSNVKVYTAWSLMDNFEWNFAYGIKFGLYRVDFSSSDRTRIPKQSAEWYGRVVLRNGLLDY